MVLRLLLLVSISLLAGCASYETRHVYDDGYYQSSGYAASSGAYGDYYVGQPSYRYVDSYYSPSYLDSPAYYSLFWGFNRWYHDPFYYPGYYYGVTYYPRNYLSFRAGWGFSRFDVGHRYFPYSPYRHAWSDHYYDWAYWQRNYPGHHQYRQQPRYGSARNEAERLAWQGRSRQQQALYSSDQQRNDPRGVDYRSRVEGRTDPRIGAFGGGQQQQRGVRDVNSMEQRRSARQDPAIGAFGSGIEGRPAPRDQRGVASRQEAVHRDQRDSLRRELGDERRYPQDGRRLSGQQTEQRGQTYMPRSVERAAPEARTRSEPRTRIEQREYVSEPIQSRPMRSSRPGAQPFEVDRQRTASEYRGVAERRPSGREEYSRPEIRQQPARAETGYSSRDRYAAPAYPRATREAPQASQQQEYQQLRSAPRGEAGERSYSAPRQATQHDDAPRAERSPSPARSESRRGSRDDRDED